MTPNTVRHMDFCLPRPGETTVRMESYRLTRTNEAGDIIGRPLIERCQECGAQTVDGQPTD